MKCQEALNEVFRQVFANPKLDITPELTPNDIDGWDSMAHVNLIAAVELRFKIKFDSKELRKMRTVGDLGQLIDGKIG
jgi:acyl carrier protein